MKKPRRLHSSAGFTIVEIMVVVPILVVTVLFLFDALFVMIRTSTVDRANIDMLHDNQTALTNIESDVLLGSLFLPTPDSQFVDPSSTKDPYPPASGSWSYVGSSSTSRVLIAKVYNTTTNSLASDRKPVYIGNPAGSECSGNNIYFNEVLQYDIIYFVKNTNLYRRKLVDNSTGVCDPGKYQKYSCPSVADLALEGIFTRDSQCQADDELLARDVTDFSVQYYDTPTGTTPLDVYAGGADPNLVTTAVNAEVSITISRKAYGQTVSSTSKLRLAKLNL